MNLQAIPVGDQAPEVVNTIIEIPEGSSQKMEYDHGHGVFRLDRTLFSPLYYPCNYGFIPSTLYLDGDPLDILVLCNHPIPTGTLAAARPVGVMRMRDDKGADDKIIGVFANDPRYEDVHDLDDITPHLRKEIRHFFKVYKELEDKAVDVEGWHPKGMAHDIIRRYTVQK